MSTHDVWSKLLCTSVDNFVCSDLNIVGCLTGCYRPSRARASRVCVKKKKNNNVIFVCLENGCEGEFT